jgi:hypothetical protein
MTNASKIVLTLIILAIVVGGGIYLWQMSQQNSQENVTQQTELKTYLGNSFTAQYPSIYQISTDNLGVVTISGSNGKIMIGKFEPAAAPESAADMTQEQLDEFPKEIKYYGYEGEIASAIFYKAGDESTKRELEAIQNSIKLK